MLREREKQIWGDELIFSLLTSAPVDTIRGSTNSHIDQSGSLVDWQASRVRWKAG